MSDTIANAVEVVSEVRVAAPRDEVWAILADVQRQPEWMKDALSIEVLTDPPLGVGTKMRVPTRIGPFRTTDLMEVTAFEPPHLWTVVHRGLVTGEGTFELEEIDGGSATRVSWRERLAAPLAPLGKLGMTIMKPVLRGIFQADLERLRVLCEGDATA